jgi:molybdenum cofactor cytidylyltransferase
MWQRCADWFLVFQLCFGRSREFLSNVHMSKSKDPRPKTIAAVLLAAGRSERMSAFKPLLPFGKTTVVESCVDYLKAAGVETIVVVLGHRANEVRQQLRQTSVTFALNPAAKSEMSDSIRCGVQTLPPDMAATLVALVDHPAIPPAVVATLISAWENGAQLIIPTYRGRGGHPVLIDLRYRAELEQLEPSRGLRSLFENHPASVCRLEMTSPYIARDMDTWDDYISLHQDVFGQAPPGLKESNESTLRAI